MIYNNNDNDKASKLLAKNDAKNDAVNVHVE